MPIPPYTMEGVLPPHTGNPTQSADLSPYPTTTPDLVTHFATTPERRVILRGFLQLRARLQSLGVVHGFQWIDGSFLENVETVRGQPPQDVDVVTFYVPANPNFNVDLVNHFPEICSPSQIKDLFHVHHYMVDCIWHPYVTIDQTRYWYALFSHRRDGVWKGMLRIELNTVPEDATALNGLPVIP